MPGIPDANTAYAVTGAAVMYTLSVGSGVFVLVVGLYSVLHWKKVWPKVFSPRTFLYPTRTPIENPVRYCFSWFWEIYNISEDEILRTVGLDALVFLRMQRMYGVLFLLCSFFGLGVLLPLNLMYASPTTNLNDKFARTTMANLPPRDRIKNIHVYRTNIAGAWFFTAITIALLAYEYRRFIKLRFTWLTLPRTHNYSIMVSHIPYSMRSVTVLKAFFDRILAPHGLQHDAIGRVLSVTLTMDLTRVETLVRERERVREKLEHLMALAALAANEGQANSRVDEWAVHLRNWGFCCRSRADWKRSLARRIRIHSARLQFLNEAVECVQQETRRIFYGYENPENFGLMEGEVIPAPPAPGTASFLGAAAAAGVSSSATSGPASVPSVGLLGALGRDPEAASKLPEGGDVEMGGALSDAAMSLPSSVAGSIANSPERPPRAQADGEARSVGTASPVRRYGSAPPADDSKSDKSSSVTEVGDPQFVEQASTKVQPDEEAGGGPQVLLQGLSGAGSQNGQQSSGGAGVSALLPGISYRMRPIMAPPPKYGSFAFTRQNSSSRAQEPRPRKPSGGGGEDGPAPPLSRKDRQLSQKSRMLLEKFFSRPISSETFGTAFVTVSTLEACAMLRQAVTYQKPFEIIVEEAPMPEDIMWKNIDSNLVASSLRTGMGHILTLVITLSFSFPTAVISAMNSVSSAKRYLPWIDHYLINRDEVRRANKTLAILSPLLLLILLSAVPPIFGLLTRSVIRDSRTVSESHYLIYKRYFGFLFYNALLVFVVTTNTMDTIKLGYENPSQVLNQIGNTLTKPAAFFINFILIKALMGLPSELIRSSSFLQHALKILFVDELTEDHRRKVVLGCPSITHPGGFHYGKFLAEHTLNYVYVMCYSCLAPLILPVGLVFFLGSYMVYKRQLLFVYEPEYETGGKMFKLIFRYTFTGLFVSHFAMLCMLITKFAYEDFPFFLPLPVLTYFAMDVMSQWFGRLENHVPLYLAVSKDMRYWSGPGQVPSTQSGEILDLAKDTYHHPAVRAPWAELSRPLPSVLAASLESGANAVSINGVGHGGEAAGPLDTRSSSTSSTRPLAANPNTLQGHHGSALANYMRVSTDIHSHPSVSSDDDEDEDGDGDGGEEAYMRRLSI